MVRGPSSAPLPDGNILIRHPIQIHLEGAEVINGILIDGEAGVRDDQGVAIFVAQGVPRQGQTAVYMAASDVPIGLPILGTQKDCPGRKRHRNRPGFVPIAHIGAGT